MINTCWENSYRKLLKIISKFLNAFIIGYLSNSLLLMSSFGRFFFSFSIMVFVGLQWIWITCLQALINHIVLIYFNNFFFELFLSLVMVSGVIFDPTALKRVIFFLIGQSYSTLFIKTNTENIAIYMQSVLKKLTILSLWGSKRPQEFLLRLTGNPLIVKHYCIRKLELGLCCFQLIWVWNFYFPNVKIHYSIG